MVRSGSTDDDIEIAIAVEVTDPAHCPAQSVLPQGVVAKGVQYVAISAGVEHSCTLRADEIVTVAVLIDVSDPTHGLG
jgi:hypothetical protein